MHKLYNDDCFNVFPKLEENSVGLVLVDPPYGTTAIEWDNVLDSKKMWEGIDRVAKDDANIILFASQPFTSMLVCSKLDWFRYELIWNKNKCGSPGLAKQRPMKTHENILVFSKKAKATYLPIIEKGNPYYRQCKDEEKGYGTGKNSHKYGFAKNKLIKSENHGTRYPKSIIHCSRNFSAQQTVHPTQKPTNLLSWLILTYSNQNDVVLDFTMGSGSAGVAAIETGRNFIGVEMTKEYYDIAEKRINEAIPNSVTRETKILTTQNDFMKEDPPSAKKKANAKIEVSNELQSDEFFDQNNP